MTIADLRGAARRIWSAALERADPGTCVRQAIQFRNGTLTIAGTEYPQHGRLFVVGTGKAGPRMAQAVEELLGDHITAGLVVTRYGHRLPLERIEIVEAGHPLPDLSGTKAVLRIRDIVSNLTANDIVLCLISGGGSALWPAPTEPVTLEDKQEVTSRLLRAGASIRELNAVRKHLSAIKGGQLVRWAAPARVVSLIMSDVIGDPVDFIASGPTAPDTTSFSDAATVIDRYGIPVSTAVRQRLADGVAGRIPDTPKPDDPLFSAVDNVIIANNRLLIDAARAEAERLGFNTIVLTSELEGEAREIAKVFAATAREIGRSGNPVSAPACVLAAGETTVTVAGSGTGGRNQEMALAWSIAMDSGQPVPLCCFASIATDGTDGPTTAAGGLVDPATCSRAAARGLRAHRFLQANDAMPFLEATGDLIVTGPTQTNLMDLQILLVGTDQRN